MRTVEETLRYAAEKRRDALVFGAALDPEQVSSQLRDCKPAGRWSRLDMRKQATEPAALRKTLTQVLARGEQAHVTLASDASAELLDELVAALHDPRRSPGAMVVVSVTTRYLRQLETDLRPHFAICAGDE